MKTREAVLIALSSFTTGLIFGGVMVGMPELGFPLMLLTAVGLTIAVMIPTIITTDSKKKGNAIFEPGIFDEIYEAESRRSSPGGDDTAFQ